MEELYTNSQMFGVGEVFPPQSHLGRIKLCKENKILFKGLHEHAFHNKNYPYRINTALYVSVNLAGLICKKSSDFLFGETINITAGLGDNSPEQKALDRIKSDNNLGILLYESALSNAYCGDAFIKVRYGQEFGGDLPKELDRFRVIIENVSAEYVFPETSVWDKNRITVFHIAVPYYDVNLKKWFLSVESHKAGEIHYHKYFITPIYYNVNGECERWDIKGFVEGSYQVVKTGVNMPLIVHIPNLATADDWQGIDDLTELHPIFDEINNRLSQIASILDKHADPAFVVPTGTINGVDDEGRPEFSVATDKVFESLSKDDMIPQYITWDGQLEGAFKELDHLVEMALMTAEIPGVALGLGDSGTSGSSGLAIKWRMNALLSKINRKRQYYEKGLKQIFYLAQKLEEVVGIADYELTVPNIKFNDGLPIDEMEQANITSIRTGGAVTMSQKTAIMMLNNMTEDQADAEIQRINEENESKTTTSDPSIFNDQFDLGAIDTDDSVNTETETGE